MTTKHEAITQRHARIWEMYHDPQYAHLSKNMRHILIGKTVCLSKEGVRSALGRMLKVQSEDCSQSPSPATVE